MPRDCALEVLPEEAEAGAHSEADSPQAMATGSDYSSIDRLTVLEQTVWPCRWQGGRRERREGPAPAAAGQVGPRPGGPRLSAHRPVMR